MRHDQPFEANRARTGSPGATDREKLVWLYIPPIVLPALPSAPASEVLNSACISPSPDIELFVTSSGKPSLRPFSWRGWQTRPWIRLLSGAMSPLSTAALGAERFISSLAAIPASPSASPDEGSEKTIPGTYGRTSGGSSASSILNGVSLKMSKGTCPWAPTLSSGSFRIWALRSKQACSARSKPAQAIYGVGSSLWPTPTKSLYCNKIELMLVDDCFRLRDDPSQTGSQLALGKVARLWTHIWLLMKACGARPTKPFSFPSTHPLHLTLNAGPRSSINDLTFNPNFSDWVMGWPIGWTDPMRPVTEWSAWLRRMRGELSRLPT
jgi:hypothetical protein